MSGPAAAATPRPWVDRPAAGTPLRLLRHSVATVLAGVGRGEPALGYTPLVLVGPAGSGKSALVADVFVSHGSDEAGMPPTESSPPAPAMWDGRSLAREITVALAQDTLYRLRDRFIRPRLVIIDGIEQMAAWDVQRLFCQLMDRAVAGGTSFVVTMRTHPTASRCLDPSLASRLAGGLVVPLPPAAAAVGIPSAHAKVVPTLRRVINATARLHGLTPADLTGSSRRRQAARARSMAMYVARRLTGLSLETIGRALGGRDHTTVMHGIRVTQQRQAREPAVAAEIERLLETLASPA